MQSLYKVMSFITSVFLKYILCPGTPLHITLPATLPAPSSALDLWKTQVTYECVYVIYVLHIRKKRVLFVILDLTYFVQYQE